jgi:cytochrome c biogenesis protein CcmG, thiol:disulfide interchange protein DsbE
MPPPSNQPLHKLNPMNHSSDSRWILLLSITLFTASHTQAQDSLPQARLKSLRGTIAPFSTIQKGDSLFLICFWATTDDQSISQLNAINGNLERWKSIVPFRFLAVSIDEGKLANKIRPTVNMNEWINFEVFNDLYGDLRRSLHSNNLPQSFIIKKGKIVYQQSGWSLGSEVYLFEKLQAVRNR